jgi:hypothetical protein
MDISVIFDEEVKGPATLNCLNPMGYDNGRYNCEFDEPGLRVNLGPLLGKNPVIELNCAASECLRPEEIPPYDEFGIYSLLIDTKDDQMLFIGMLLGLALASVVSYLRPKSTIVPIAHPEKK